MVDCAVEHHDSSHMSWRYPVKIKYLLAINIYVLAITRGWSERGGGGGGGGGGGQRN
jgi:hypothetical protein